jgi:iron complex transport system ATP-binding protein
LVTHSQKENAFLMKLENLHIGYDNSTVVRNLNLEFKLGSLHTIVGINGIGKSTLIKTICGELKSIEGSVSIEGEFIENISFKELAKQISVVHTSREENKFLSVYELVQMGRYPYLNWIGKLTENDKQIIDQALALFEITEFKNQKCFELSDGQYQKALIARAFAQDTPYIILDEPSTHLDLYHKINLFKILSNLAHNYNKCIILSTHEIERAIELSDQMLVLLKDEHYFDTPQNLIDKEVFQRIFPSEMVNFNPHSKSFVLKDIHP